MAASRFSDAYKEILAGLASKDFSSAKEWQAVITRARKLAKAEGFDAGEASFVEDFRKILKKAITAGSPEANSICDAAAQDTKPSGLVGEAGAKRLGALKTLRHTYLLKRFGGHKVWCVAIPKAFTDWPHVALKGGISQALVKLEDTGDRFTTEQRKHLSNASQEALKWLHKAMIVAGDPKKKKHLALITRWFADDTSTDKDMIAAGGTLNAGFKKICKMLKSGHLIYTDSVSERGTTENENTEAFVWGDPLDVVYIEEEFFGNQNTLTGLTNWTRIVIHELTHREVKTKDHAYEHQGMAPKLIGAAEALENADSWAWFCADCAGALTDGQVTNALART